MFSDSGWFGYNWVKRGGKKLLTKPISNITGF